MKIENPRFESHGLTIKVQKRIMTATTLLS